MSEPIKPVVDKPLSDVELMSLQTLVAADIEEMRANNQQAAHVGHGVQPLLNSEARNRLEYEMRRRGVIR